MDFVGRGLERFRAVSVPVAKRQGGGARGTYAPSQVKCFSLSCSFRQKLCQIIG